MIVTHGLVLLMLDAALLSLFTLRAFHRNYDRSDRGSGQVVAMAAPLRASYLRCSVFLVISCLASAALIGFQHPDMGHVYHGLVRQLLLSSVPEPSVVDGYVNSLLPVFPFSVLAFGLAFAVTFRATLGRRLVILLHTAVFLVASAVADAIFGTFVIATGLPLGPTPIANMLIQYMLAGVLCIRLAFTSFQLPNTTSVPLRRRGDIKDDCVLICCVATAIALTAAGAVFAVGQLGHDPLAASIVVFACPPYLLILISLLLGLVRLTGRRRADPTDRRPPIEVITAAYNEELNIVNLIRSLDDAAGRYGGSVRFVLSDDGSTDGTRELAESALELCRHLTGQVIAGTHAGKSGALNRALGSCQAEIVYRIDADCVVDSGCFLYSVPHFLADPHVGLVGAFTLPKEPYTTWIDRMRMFEMIVGFGFGRPCSDVVDGIACIPGTFTAFRRQAAVDIGGFVEGMYGEDVDFTCAIARLGYRAVIDTRVRSYEDVPNTQAQLRVQRTRWNRGGSMSFARFAPVVTGPAGPRFWFFTTRAASKRFLTPLHLSTFTYIVCLAALHPTMRLNLARAGFILLMKGVPGLLQLVICTLYYGRARYLGWLPLRYGFVLLKHYYGLEAFLSFNARPVVTPQVRQAFGLRGTPGLRDAA